MSTFWEVAGNDPASARFRILLALRDHGPTSRASLARRASLAPSTVTNLVRALQDDGAVCESEPVTPQRRTGPHSRSVLLNTAAGTVIGVDFGFRTVRVLVCDAAGDELASSEGRLPDFYSAPAGLELGAGLIRQALAAADRPLSSVDAIGVALPGPVDALHQRISGSFVLPGWDDQGAADFERAFGGPVVLENDANLAALGEHIFGAGRGVANSLTVKFHSGIGAGIMIDNRLVSGARGGAGEIGHTCVDPRGPLCRCGKRGCLDTLAAAPALIEAMSAQHPTMTLSGFLDLVAAGDSGARRVMRDAAELVGRAVADACLLLAPERVIVAGALARAGEAVLGPVREAIDREALPGGPARPSVCSAELGVRSTALGAVALALRSTGWLPGSRHTSPPDLASPGGAERG